MVRKFIASDYPTLVGWYRERNLKPPSLEMLPSIGYIVEGKAASFLYNVEGKFGYSEGSVTNKRADRSERTAALMQVWDAVIVHARELGLKSIVSSVSVAAIAKYAKEKGFTLRPDRTFLIKEL